MPEAPAGTDSICFELSTKNPQVAVRRWRADNLSCTLFGSGWVRLTLRPQGPRPRMRTGAPWATT